MIKRHPILSVLLFLLVVAGAYYAWLNRPVPDFGRSVLVFSQSEGSRHDGISAGIETIEALVRKGRFNVLASEDASLFSDDSLSAFQAVIFLNTSGDVLNEDQRIAFERYIQAGGGYVGIHAAADTRWDDNGAWFWYQRLVGGVFAGYPKDGGESSTLIVTEPNNPVVNGLDANWAVSGERADFGQFSKGITVLVAETEVAIENAGEDKGDNRPMAWLRKFDGGRSFYTALGHTEAIYEDANYRELLQAGIEYAMGEGAPLDYSRSRPEPWRFTRTVLESNLTEPLKLTFSPTGNLYFVERRGDLRRYDFEQGKSILVHRFSDLRTFNEYGLLGLAFAPDFSESHWLYLFRTIDHGDAGQQVLSRFQLKDGVLDVSSEQVLLTFEVDGNENRHSSHTGGDLLFDHLGGLWLSTGDDTKPGDASLIDDRPGHIAEDAGRSAGNTQDLRGKILRIKPRDQPDENGRYYDIPAGNLFTSADDGRPEIYVMGLRNPYTLSYDHRRQRIYWGEVGPDARAHDDRGPWGFDEVNFAEKPGNFGWPYVIADNQPYRYYDYDAQKVLDLADVNAPVNTSRNNTGLKVLPPAQPAWIYYPYSDSEEFFELGSGGRNALVVPIYYSDEVDTASEIKFPSYFDGKLLISDFVRRWLMVVNTDAQGRPETIVPVFDHVFSAPLDMAYGPDGALYVVEYGTDWFSQNMDAYLSRIEYYSGDNAPPIAVARASKTIGAAPLQTELDASGSFDRGAGSGKLSYRWQLIEEGKPDVVVGDKEVQPYTFERQGEYFMQLTATDEGGQQSSQRIRFRVGNERPDVQLELEGNRSFYWEDQPVEYRVVVNDKEDGSTASGDLTGADIAVNFGYVAGGEDLAKARLKLSVNPVLAGEELVTGGSDCHACHGIDSESIGPSFLKIAERYAPREDAAAYLESVIVQGSSGQWEGSHAMPGHPGLSPEQLNYISSYILSLSSGEQSSEGSALSGVLRFDQHQEDHIDVVSSDNLSIDLGRLYPGAYLLGASYTDKGTESAPALQGQKTLLLRSPRLTPSAFDDLVRMRGFGVQGEKIAFVVKPWASAPLSYGMLKGIDLTGIRSIKIATWAQKPIMLGGPLELRLDSPRAKTSASANVKSELIASASGTPVELDVSGIEGVHDLYIGASLPEDDADAPEVHQALYAILTMEFLR